MDFLQVVENGNNSQRRRKLMAAGNMMITLGYTMASRDNRMFNFVQEQVLDTLTTSPVVIPTVTSWAMAAAVTSNFLPPTFNFTGVSHSLMSQLVNLQHTG